MKAQLGTDGPIPLLNSSEGPLCEIDRYRGVVQRADFRRRYGGAETRVEIRWIRDLAISRGSRVYVAMGNNPWKLKLPQQAGPSPALLQAMRLFPIRNLNRKPSEGFALAADGRGKVPATFLSDKLFAIASRDDGTTFTESAKLTGLEPVPIAARRRLLWRSR